MITTTERRPLFADLGDMAKKITAAIREQSDKGVKAKAVHVNPRMKELMDQMAGFTIKTIGAYPVVANEKTPLERFWLEKLPA